MMQIRYGVFETNSSSTHSLYFANDKEWEDFWRGRTLLDVDNGNFILWEDAVEAVIKAEKENVYKPPFWNEDEETQYTEEEFRALSKEEQYDSFLRHYDYCSYESLGQYKESYEDEYITEHGDHVHVFGEYGYDG